MGYVCVGRICGGRRYCERYVSGHHREENVRMPLAIRWSYNCHSRGESFSKKPYTCCIKNILYVRIDLEFCSATPIFPFSVESVRELEILLLTYEVGTQPLLHLQFLQLIRLTSKYKHCLHVMYGCMI